MTRSRSVRVRLGATAVLCLAATAAAADEPRSGAEIYALACTACHETGTAGAPKRGDAKAWKPLIAEGQATLSRMAIKGIRGMPPKGGRPDLADVEVRRAVAYLANTAGAKWPEPKK